MQEGLITIRNTEALKKIVGPREGISIRCQCEIMNLNMSTLYYQPVDEDPEDLDLMRKMDEEFHKHPTKGVISMVDFIKGMGILVGPKRIRRLLRKMGIMAIYPQRNHNQYGWQRQGA